MRSAFRSASVALFAGLLLLLGFTLLRAGPGSLPGEENKRDKTSLDPGAVEVRFTDNSSMKLLLKEPHLTLNTAYGKLQIPIADVHKIEFASRVSEEILKRVETCIHELGSEEYARREQATAVLMKLGERAFPALLVAMESKDPEVTRRAEKLLEKIRGEVPEDLLVFRKTDVVYTADSKIAGQIENSGLKAQTFQFGEVKLKLADMHALRSMSVPREQDEPNALDDPGTLLNYTGQMNKELRFRVTGAAAKGGLWGTKVYTLDSSLGMAAVHAGVLKMGQTGVVKVRIVPAPPAFAGSNQNGITSQPFGAFPAGAYQVSK